MKTRFVLLFCLAFAALSRAEEPGAPTVALAGDGLTADQLEQLVGPIALYPDALLALMLPAATAPADIVLAARYLKDDGNPAEVSSRSWDESVKSLVHYAEVVKWMDDNLSWTKQLGEAFREQPAEVMQAIQRMRAKARAAGTLLDAPQQQVVIDREVIAIIPAQANYLYVPYYDPLVVYAPRPEYYGTSFISFSSPFAVGSWLRFDCDWRQRTVWTVDRRWTSRDHADWRHPVFPGQPGYVHDPGRHPWHPSAMPPHMPIVNAYRRNEVPRPAAINAPPGPTYTRDTTPDRRNDPRDRPQRTDPRARDPNFVGPVATATTAPTAPITTATMVPAPSFPTTPPSRRPDPGRVRNDTGAPPNRTIAFQNPPVTQSLAQAPQPASNYPSGPAPSSRVAPAFNGPVVSSMPMPATQPQHLHMPAPAPAPAPVAPPPAQPPSDNKRGVNDGGDQKKQLN